MASSKTSAASAAATATDDELARTLRFAVARLARLLRQQDQTGVGPTFTAALYTISQADGITHGELATAEQLAPPTITALVAKMETMGLVVRRTDASDRRVTRIDITPAGRRQLDDVRHRRTAWLQERLEGLTAEERGRLLAAADVLAKLTEAPGDPA